jgi:hypothetical protein
MERLSKSCAAGVPFSAFELAVKVRKDTPRKGRPQEILKSSQRPATTETTQSSRSLQLPDERAHDLAGRCFF